MEKLRIIVGFGIALVWLGSVAVHGQGAQAVEEDQTPDSKVETKVIEQAIEEASEEGQEQEQEMRAVQRGSLGGSMQTPGF